MGNQFTALPAPAGNGPGTPVDVSTFGLLKTVTYVAPAPPFLFKPTVIIEFSNEFVPVHFAPLAVLGQPDEVTIPVAAHWMRVTVANYKGGGAPVVNVGANDSAPSFATLIAPPGSGQGVGVDVSSMGAIKTIHVATVFRGALNIEISEDGGATYNQICTFYGPGHRTLTFAADFMRATRVGVPQSMPGTPLINIGAAADGGGGVSGLTVEDEGISLGLFTTMNFIGAGVTATDAGGGTVDVTIPGGGGANTIDLEDEGTPLGSFTTLDLVGAGVTATDLGGGVAQLAIPGSGVAGTPNQVPKFTSPTTLGDSVISDTGTGVAMAPLTPIGGTALQVTAPLGGAALLLDLLDTIGGGEVQVGTDGTPAGTYVSAPLGLLNVLATLANGAINVSAGGVFNDLQLVDTNSSLNPPAGGATVTGFVVPVGAPTATWIGVANIGAGPATLKNQNLGSVAANRIVTPGAADLVIPAGGGFWMIHVDIGGGVKRWVILGVNALATVVSTEQVFRYAVTGAEGNPFPVALPAARASVNYNVQIQLGGPVANAFKDYRPLIASFAVGTFNVECGAAPEAGDILMLTVEDLT